MTTPKQLQRFADKHGMSYEELARAISKAVNYDVSTAAIWKFCTGRTTPQRIVRHAIETYMDAQGKEARA